MNKEVLILNRTVLNIKNFIPHEIIVCDDKDSARFNGKFKSLINENSEVIILIIKI